MYAFLKWHFIIEITSGETDQATVESQQMKSMQN